MTKAKFALTVDADVLEGVKSLAAEDSRTLSAYINKVLTDHLREKRAFAATPVAEPELTAKPRRKGKAPA